MKKIFTFLFFILFYKNLFSQVVIDDAGDNWKPKIETAIQLIETYDYDKYLKLTQVCNRISYWNGKYSTTEGIGTIIISSIEMRDTSIQNIAAVIIHESYHLMKINDKDKNEYLEEYDAYIYELDFLSRLPNPNKNLLEHCIKMALYYLELASK
jgi:hypothetical protein